MRQRYNYGGKHNITAEEAIQLLNADGYIRVLDADMPEEEADQECVKDEHADVTSYEQSCAMCVSYDYELIQAEKKPWWQLW